MRSNNLSLSIFLDAQSYQSEDDLYDYYDDFENEEEEEESEEDSEVSFLFSKSTETDRNELKMNSISKNRRMRSQIMKIITTSCMIETLDSTKDSPLLKFLHFLILNLIFQDTLLMKRKMMQQSNN